jgi:hypothetical protein
MAAAVPGAASYDDELRSRETLREAFGDSSESDSDAPREAASSPLVAVAGRKRWRWGAVAAVRGLWLCADFLSSDDQLRLLAAIQRGEPLAGCPPSPSLAWNRVLFYVDVPICVIVQKDGSVMQATK